MQTLVAFLLGVLALGALVAYAGPRRVVEAVREASPAWLLLALLAYASFFLLRGWRWRSLLSRSAPHVRFSSTASVSAVGWLANSFIPLKGGDVVRSALLAKRESLPAGTAAATVALERVLDMVGLALIAALGLFLLPHDGLPTWFGRALEVAWLMPLLGIAALLVLVIFRRHAIALSERACAKLGAFGKKLHDFIATTITGIEALVRHPRLMMLVLPQSALVTLAQTLVFTCLVRAFLPGTPLVVAFGGSAVFLLSFVISVTPGNVGTYEAAFAAVFTALHAAPLDAALAAGILTHVTTTLLVGLLGGAGLVTLGLGRQRAPTTAPDPAGAGIPGARRTPVGGGRA